MSAPLAVPPGPSLPKRSIEDPDNRTVWLRGVPEGWSEVHLLKYFDRFATKIEAITPICDSLDCRTDRALFRFIDARAAEEFVQRYHNDFINSPEVKQRLNCSMFALRKASTRLEASNQPNEVELYNLPFEATNLDVLRLVGEPAPARLQMPMRTPQLNKGFGVLTFATPLEAKEFVEKMHGLSLMGRKLGARQKYMSFVTHKPALSTKSDQLFARAESEEVRIEGSLLRALVSEWPDAFKGLEETLDQ